MRHFLSLIGLACKHKHIMWPRKDDAGRAYTMCMDCRKILPYNNNALVPSRAVGNVNNNEPSLVEPVV
jgi:hypothetical protein